MNQSIWTKIASTPWTVYVSILVILYLARIATKPKIVSLRQFTLIPCLFVISATLMLALTIKFTLAHVLIWTFLLLIGTVIGWLHFKINGIKAIPNERRFLMPGTYSLFMVLLVFVFFNIFPNSSLSVNTMLDPSDPNYPPLILSTYGLCTGLFLGRFLFIRKLRIKGPFISLEEAKKRLS